MKKKKTQVKSTSILSFFQSKLQTESTSCEPNTSDSNTLISLNQTETDSISKSNILIGSTTESSTNSGGNILYINDGTEDETNIASTSTSFYVPEESFSKSCPNELFSDSSKYQ